MDGFDKMILYGVSLDIASKQPIVLLKSEGSNRYLPIWIGETEAAAIMVKLQNTSLPRPMTHDLLTSVLGSLSAKVDRILVTELKDNTFYAVLRLVADGQQIDVDSRPSDAIAVAVRTDAPIFASHELLEANAIELEQEPEEVEEVVTEFRDFLDHISPEDF